MYDLVHQSLCEIFLYALFTKEVIVRNICLCTIYYPSHSTKYLCMYHLLHKSLYEIFMYLPFKTQLVS